jgi:hypothetical protein
VLYNSRRTNCGQSLKGEKIWKNYGRVK